eukprot:gb/GEZN01010428.1/.p1 GENE.gb/GEZN01010428.1/~~gb/GEZN01010428.1/.p1  ORF type:complete len:394 (-),score=57.62 gb/GEZN01010428.1/:35-1216(-)
MGCASSSASATQPKPEFPSHELKVLLLGDRSTGGNNFVSHYIADKDETGMSKFDFDKGYSASYQVEGHDMKCHFALCDSSDQYDRLRPLSYPGTHIALVFYKSNQRNTYLNLVRKHHPEIIQHAPHIGVYAVEIFNEEYVDEERLGAIDYVQFRDVIAGINIGVRHVSVNVKKDNAQKFIAGLLRDYVYRNPNTEHKQKKKVPLRYELQPFLRMDYVLENGFLKHQDIPASAKSSTYDSLLVISHRWHDPVLCDKDKLSLNFLREHKEVTQRFSHIFFDFSSLPQGKRTAEQTRSFIEALRLMGLLYSQESVFIIPAQDYLDRAWCCLEIMLASHFNKTINSPYPLESVQHLDLSTKIATNPADIPIVQKNYDDFVDRFNLLEAEKKKKAKTT